MCPGFRGVGPLDSHATASPSRCSISYSIGVRIQRLLRRRWRLWEILRYSEIASANSIRVFHRQRFSGSVRMRPQNDLMTLLSKQSPIEPIDATSPDSWARRVNAQDVDCAPWSL